MPHDAPRYSIAEVERRWLVDPATIGDLSQHSYRLFEDLYINESRLRLRKITKPDGTAIFKLGKKYGKHSHLSEPITTLYLTEREYQQLACLPGHSALKRRYAIEGGHLDVYDQPALGSQIFELEFADEASALLYVPPCFVTREVTGDPAFSGYQLAKAHAA